MFALTDRNTLVLRMYAQFDGMSMATPVQVAYAVAGLLNMPVSEVLRICMRELMKPRCW